MFNELSANLRKLRDKAGLAQFDLAVLCNVSPSHISRIERGDTNVRLETLGRMARALKVCPEELISSKAKDEICQEKL